MPGDIRVNQKKEEVQNLVHARSTGKISNKGIDFKNLKQ